MVKRRMTINGLKRTLVVDPNEKLSTVLREQLLLTGCKIGCGVGHCGTCSVILNGKVVRACIVKMSKIKEDDVIETIEGIGTPDNLHPLQVAWMAHGAAQCGFCSPGFIMSAKGLLDQNVNPTRAEVRQWFHDNKNLCRCTGYVPLVDAVMDAAAVMRGEKCIDDLMFKQQGNDSIYGSKYVRPTALNKVTGTWDFGADGALQLPTGTLRLAMVQADVSHANIKGIDYSEAEKMPGVYKVITYKDVKGKNRISGLITFPTNKGDGWDRPILCDEKVFQFGDCIALVAADTEAHAKAAAKAVKVDLEVLPAYMSAPAAIEPDAIEIHPGTPNAYYEIKNIKGEETAPIMEKAAHVIEVDSFCSRQPHLHIEPDCGFAYTDEKGAIAVHSKSIGIHLHMLMIAEGVGLTPDTLRLIQSPAGGTFGYKFSPTIEALLAVACIACDGKAVSLVFDQFQNITYTGKRSPGVLHTKLAADDEGNLLALEGDYLIDHGPYSEFGDLLTLRLPQYVGAGYRLPNIRTRSQTICTNHAYGAAFRGYGSPQSFMAGEIAMDIMADELGMDPFDFRQKNVYNEERGDTTPSGCQPDVYCLAGLFEKMKPKYEEAVKRCKEMSTDDVKYAVGLAVGIYGSGLDGKDSSEAWAEITPNGVSIGNSWEDHGQGADIGTLTHAHEVLRAAGITPEQINLVMNDTHVTPNSGPSGGSRNNVMTGNSTREAAQNLLNAMKKDDGTYRTYDEFIAEGLPVRYEGKWVASCCEDCSMETGQGIPFSVYMYDLFMPEVAVDMKTFKAKVVRFTAAVDLGTITNYLACYGQVLGGVTQGIGLGLTEDFEDLKKHTTLRACGIPDILDVPDADDFEIIFQETPRPWGSHGCAGAGEGPLSAPHVAIVNAVSRAIGARVTQVPALPSVIKAAYEGNPMNMREFMGANAK